MAEESEINSFHMLTFILHIKVSLFRYENILVWLLGIAKYKRGDARITFEKLYKMGAVTKI